MRFLAPNQADQADLAVIIVSWNVQDLLLKNLEALWQSTGDCLVRVIVIDNASKDGTVEALKTWSDRVTVVINQNNLGFSKAVNQGLKIANSRHVLLLNPDMKIYADALDKTVRYLDTHPEVGVLGGHLLNEDGSTMPSVRRFPDISSQLAILMKVPHIFPRTVDHYHWKDFDYEQEQDVDQVRGSYFAISSNGLKQVSHFDEHYFIWFEEVDFCKQIHEAGLKVRYVPDIRAQDFVGRSFAQHKLFWKQKQLTKSMAHYFWKWQPGWRAMLISVLRPLPVCAAWLHDKIV